jgi:hypothetical protein
MTKITLSDQAIAIGALAHELDEVEKMQLAVGEQVAELLFKQVVLAERFRGLQTKIKEIMQCSLN